MSIPDELLTTADDALAKAKRHADEAEIVLRHDESAGALIRGELSSGRDASRTLLGVRLRMGRRIGIASGALSDADVVDRVIEQARHAASIAAEAAYDLRFAEGERLVTRAFREETPPAGTLDARERAALLADRVRGAAEYFTVSTGGARMRIVVATSGGTLAADAGVTPAATVEARVNERLPRAITAGRMGRAALDLDGFAEEILQDLKRAQHVAPLPAGKETIVFDAQTASKLIPSLTMHLNASLVRHGLSRYSGKLGERVLSEALTIRDAAEGTALGGRAREMDDEGVRTRAREIVSRGVVKDLVFNAEEARLADRRDAAGNGFRGGEVVDAPPRPGFVQAEIVPGRRALAAIVAGSKRAILVKHELLGWYHSTGVTGLVSVVAPCAFLVENGEIVSGLSPVTLGFDALAALADAELEIGADAAVTPQGVSAPMVLRGVAAST